MTRSDKRILLSAIKAAALLLFKGISLAISLTILAFILFSVMAAGR